MSSDKIFEKIMDLNLKINRNYLSKTVFENNQIENIFQEYKYRESKIYRISVDLFLILGYISFFIFVLCAFYRKIFIITGSVFFFLSIILITISHLIKNRQIIKILDLIQIILSSLNLILKGLLISIYYNNKIFDNHEEITRIIIYEFLSTNLLISFLFESDMKIYLYFFLQNLGLIIVAIKYSIKDRFYQYEAIVSFFISFIFFMIRKEWDYTLRLTFSEKYKFQVYFNYAFDYFNGLNCFTINIHNNKNIYYTNNFAQFVNKNEFSWLQDLNEPHKQLDNCLKNDENFEFYKNQFIIKNIDENSPLFIDKEKFFEFANNLRYFKENSVKNFSNKKIVVESNISDENVRHIIVEDDKKNSINCFQEIFKIGKLY